MKKFVVVMVCLCGGAFSGWGMESYNSSGVTIPRSSSGSKHPLSPSHSGSITRFELPQDEIIQALKTDDVDKEKTLKILNQYPEAANCCEVYMLAAQKGNSLIITWPFLPENRDKLTSLNLPGLLLDVCRIIVDISNSQNQVNVLTAIYKTGIFSDCPKTLQDLGIVTAQQANKNKGSQLAKKLDSLVKSWKKK